MRGQGASAAIVAALEMLKKEGAIDELRERGTSGASHRTRRAFDEFVRRTSADWDRMSRELFRRWQLPAAVQVEDVYAELLAAVWKVLPQWDPAGRPLADYLCWNAYAMARKWIHGQRDAYRRDGSSPGRFPIADASLAGSGAEDGTDRRRSVIDQEESVWYQPEVSAEARIDGQRMGASIAASLPPDEAEAFLLLLGEVATKGRGQRSPEYRAARKLSGEARLRNGITSDRRARGFVGRAQDNAVKLAAEITAAA